MSCNIKRIKGCEIAGSTFNGRKLSLNRDFSNDTFKAKVKTFNQKPIAEITGIKNATDVYFPFNGLENLSAGLYIIEYWGNFEDIGNELFCIEEFSVVAPSKAGEAQCCDNYNVFNFVTEDISIDIQITATIVNIGGNVDLSNYYTKLETYSKVEIDSLLNAKEVTKPELDILISENKLEPNRLYKITGVESWCFSQHLIKAIYLKAITNNTLESEGVGEFYTPKYNNSDSNLGIWKGELLANGMISSASYNIGDKVIWGNLFWENISGNIGSNLRAFDGFDDGYLMQNWISETDWQLITPNDDESLYNIQFDAIKYDLENDYINYRADDLGNVYELPYNVLLELNIVNIDPTFIYYLNGIALFQWSNDYFQNNKVSDSLVINCNYKHVFKGNFIIEKSIINDNNFFNVDFIGNIFKNSKAIANYLKTYGGLLYNNLDNSSINLNKYYFEISYNNLKYNSRIYNNTDNNIIVGSKYSRIKGNNLDNFGNLSNNIFVEEGKSVINDVKRIYDNNVKGFSTISGNTIKNGSRIYDNNLSNYDEINGNILDTDANIYRNFLKSFCKINGHILTGHGRIYGNTLYRQGEITNCKLRISPASSFASGIHSNEIWSGKIENIDFGNIINPSGTNPNDPAFGGSSLDNCIIKNKSIIKDLILPDSGGVGLQFIKMNGASEFKNITVNDSIRSVEFINTVFDETSDYSKIIQGAAYGGVGFTKYYLDNVLLQDRFDEKQDKLQDITGNVGVGKLDDSATEKLDVNGYVKATGYKTSTGTENQSLTADGGTFDLNTKADLVDGKVPSSQLPSYVDDVLEFANLASFPATGESGKIYIALDTNKTYRWSGSVYVIISESLALGETSSTAYRGDRGKIAYDHSQATGNAHNTKVEELTDVSGDATSIVDTDVVLKKESGGLWKKISWVNIKATLKAYFDGLYAPKSFNVKVTTPSSWVTGTTSETEVLRIEIPANSISDNSFLNMPILYLSKIGTNGNMSIKGKLSTSPTMPSGGTDQIFGYTNVGATITSFGMDRIYIISDRLIKGFPFQVSSLSSSSTNTNSFGSKEFDRTVTNYLYISIQLGNSADQARLEGVQFTNS